MSEIEGPIFTVYDSNCYWSMPDGSNRCITDKDAAMINALLRLKPARIERFRARIAELEAEAAAYEQALTKLEDETIPETRLKRRIDKTLKT